ncbi:PREDICTED: cardiolipin synthase (CMP-forming)-like [Acropora digitifera]|uniref:cardiolipin synthase (CMP-forming)-like n=1 Tax=Acropora digitifera TaxID=70779 RepID=UPI00077A3B50|nr:PREDICTED: cardiolipin synthase (CMP-forming)-like [Acropora digitifera]
MPRINTQWSRNINGTLLLLHRDPGEAKLRGIQFKAKIEQMKEMCIIFAVPLTVLILSRDAFLVSYAFYLRFKSLPSPKSLSRYFDINLPTVELRPNLLGKVNTVLQLALVGCSLAAPVLGFVGHPYLHYLWFTVATSTIMSSISYLIYFKESVKYLK